MAPPMRVKCTPMRVHKSIRACNVWPAAIKTVDAHGPRSGASKRPVPLWPLELFGAVLAVPALTALAEIGPHAQVDMLLPPVVGRRVQLGCPHA
eukprot:171571-Prymnesium_polylepis.3